MRTKALLIVGSLLAAGVVSSMAQSNVYSLNVVGYVNTVLVGGSKYTAVANPLNSTNNTLGSLLGSIPPGSQVLKFNPGLGDFDTYNRVGFGSGWSPASGATTSLNPGEGVLVFMTGGDITNTFVGEVMQGNLTNSFVSGYQQKGSIVPESGPITSMQMTNVPNASQFLKWDINIQDYQTFNKVVFGSGWSPGVPTLNVGESFLLFASGPFEWVRNFTVQ